MANDELCLYLAETENSSTLALKINDFSGPLDLLLYLISKHKIDIYDIPIKELTEQYFAFLENAKAMNLEIASEFVLMAATLMQIKSRLLLPLNEMTNEEIEDPRNDLVFQLLQYKRCKQLALSLQSRYETYCYSIERVSLSKKEIGIEQTNVEIKSEQCSLVKLEAAIIALAKRNGEMYQNLSEKLRYILAREKISLKERIFRVFQKVKEVGEFQFLSLLKDCSKEEKITYFLALLELVRRQLVRAKQADFQADITIQRHENAGEIDLDLNDNLAEYQ